MINGMPIFYSYKSGKGLEPVQTKKGGSCNKKCNKKRLKDGGLVILK